MAKMLVSIFAACSIAGAAIPAAAQSYPSRPIIGPFPPDGANDIVARLPGPRLTERFTGRRGAPLSLQEMP